MSLGALLFSAFKIAVLFSAVAAAERGLEGVALPASLAKKIKKTAWRTTIFKLYKL